MNGIYIDFKNTITNMYISQNTGVDFLIGTKYIWKYYKNKNMKT